MDINIYERPVVRLIGYTKPVDSDLTEKVIAAAGKLCYSKVSTEELLDNLEKEDIERFVTMLRRMGHESPIEHISFTFSIEGISRSCSHQLVRHRLASYSQQSQRYVDLNDTLSVVVPSEIKKNKEAYDKFLEAAEQDKKYYQEITNILKDEYIKSGMDKKQASKKAIENARAILPNACETKLIMTMNARSLLNFFKERCCNRAQEEIRDMAYQMLDLVLDIAPDVFANAGPSCAFGKCKEGSMSCGKVLKPLEKQLKINDRNRS